jgi:transposase InsO family protein
VPPACGQPTSIRYTQRLAEIGAAPSVGTVGDSYDNSLAESTIGLLKTELTRRHGPWRNLDQVELAVGATSTGSTTAGCTARSATFTGRAGAIYYRQLDQAAAA